MKYQLLFFFINLMLIQLKVFLLQEISHIQNMMYTHISLDYIFSKDEKNGFMTVTALLTWLVFVK